MIQKVNYDYWWACMQNGFPARMKQIADYAGGTMRLYGMNEEQLCKVKGISKHFAACIYNRRNTWNLEKEYAGLEQKGIQFIPWYHKAYPKRLLQTQGCPFALFVKGSLPQEEMGSVAIVGARECSEYGRSMAEYFGRELSANGVQIISGMAYGIDGYAQRAALHAGGSSYGVLGCGVDICYPSSNRQLYESLTAQGGVISEYSPGTKPLARLFPARNRIISALSDIVLVVEARKKSGTIITVDMALEQGREVLVVPGRITDPLSVGCNNLLKQGANPAQTAEDVLSLLGKQYSKNIKNQEKEKIKLESEEKLVYCCLDASCAKSLEEISFEVSCSFPKLLHILVSLELKGLAKEVGQNHYVRVTFMQQPER